ncbi:hypothetical protein HYH03_001589 [Edaphochlamys debaryana]|uniref:Uncharacterized protein n=1 Tax=Edaphochlamys debaryana TaxID=47281 RepID=A0A835YFL5_9CHLO|nr:hypothetical protein HYH03_001589 [Edaphochlamys debaryana]|eukprot:KAG2500827.1 hypothetical protein HYH03_001589 [Edaphochlamys debaryana]
MQRMSGRARLFVADNSPAAPAIIIIDLPSFNVSQRIQMPGTSLQLGVSQEQAHLGVFRNRDNDQQTLTIISTGIRPPYPVGGVRLPNPAPLAEGELGAMRPALLAKSFIFVNGSDGIGGVEGGRQLTYHPGWKRYISYAESHGHIFLYRSDHLHGATAFKPTHTFKIPAGHFHVLPYGDHIVTPHTGTSMAYLLDAKGKTLRSYACAACHGAGVYVPSESGKVAVFGCNGTVLVVKGTSATGIHLPAFPPRVGSFTYGVPGVFWSASAAQAFFWRTDVRSDAPAVTSVPHRGAAIRMLALPGGLGRFAALHLDGSLVLYDGDTGAAVTDIQLRAQGFANMTAPSLQSEADGSAIYVAVSSLGEIHRITVTRAEGAEQGSAGAALQLDRSLTVGGFPAAMTLAYMPGVVKNPQDSR